MPLRLVQVRVSAAKLARVSGTLVLFSGRVHDGAFVYLKSLAARATPLELTAGERRTLELRVHQR